MLNLNKKMNLTLEFYVCLFAGEDLVPKPEKQVQEADEGGAAGPGRRRRRHGWWRGPDGRRQQLEHGRRVVADADPDPGRDPQPDGDDAPVAADVRVGVDAADEPLVPPAPGPLAAGREQPLQHTSGEFFSNHSRDNLEGNLFFIKYLVLLY